MVLPSGGPTSAHASSSIEDDLDLEGPLESLAREKLAHDNSSLNASWGNFRKPESVHDDGWGSTPGNIRKPASIHDDGNLPAPSPNTIDGLDLTLDYLIPIIHAPISLELYMART